MSVMRSTSACACSLSGSGMWFEADTNTSVGHSIIPPLCSARRSSLFASGRIASSSGPFARNSSSRNTTCELGAWCSMLRVNSPVLANSGMS
jgi:hypothetical protein